MRGERVPLDEIVDDIHLHIVFYLAYGIAQNVFHKTLLSSRRHPPKTLASKTVKDFLYAN